MKSRGLFGLGYGIVGWVGGEIETPRLGGLAAGGVRFTPFYNMAAHWPLHAMEADLAKHRGRYAADLVVRENLRRHRFPPDCIDTA